MRRLTATLVLVVPLLGLTLGACGEDDSPDGIDEVGVVAGGKEDGSSFSSCELQSVPRWLNEGPGLSDLLAAGIHSQAAAGIIKSRNGVDGTFGTRDDKPFLDIAGVDRVPYVGKVAIQQLVKAVASRCQGGGGTGQTEVIFSPQLAANSHLVRIAKLIDGAQRSVDIAMYSFSDAGVTTALKAAVARGVRARFIYDGTTTDRTDPTGGKSGQLESLGIEVRWVNRIMHHKFMLIDGPVEDLAAAKTGTLATGSANWSSGAATRYDENTVFFFGQQELNLRFQREFNHLWDSSRDFIGNETLAHLGHAAISDADLASAEDPEVEAYFTSANFKVTQSSTNGWTHSRVRGLNTVSDQLIALIESAQKSIRIASGHLRHRGIAEALIAARTRNPALDIRVYLDAQEYLSVTTHQKQLSDLETCQAGATTANAQEDCVEKGFLFSYQVQAAGVGLRFKYYAYRWDFSYAPQMHHKYMIIDDSVLATGSMNFSDNAEHATMENISVLRGPTHKALVDRFIENFETLWVTGQSQGLFASLMAKVQSGGAFPIVFDAMALDWKQVTDLKRAMRSACPAVDSAEYRSNAAAHFNCTP